MSDHPFVERVERVERLGHWADGVATRLFIIAVILAVGLVWLYVLWRLAFWALGLVR